MDPVLVQVPIIEATLTMIMAVAIEDCQLTIQELIVKAGLWVRRLMEEEGQVIFYAVVQVC